MKRSVAWLAPVLLSIAVSAVMVGAALWYVAARRAASPSPAAAGKSVQLPYRDVILGREDAPVTIVEYGDYQCFFCLQFFADTEAMLRDRYIQSGRVRMVFRDFAVLGPESVLAAEAAACAKDQGKFWAYHDLLYAAEGRDLQENSGTFTEDLFMTIAERLNLDVEKFRSCVQDRKYREEIQQEIRAAKAMGVQGTPTFFINGEKFEGYLSGPQLERILSKMLQSP
ncbi:DsbA family protein [Candidatus Parcubacteria bacterium]|nr:MAG: DsbA family protein [Candidatus Parcubacteria bacterium]